MNTRNIIEKIGMTIYLFIMIIFMFNENFEVYYFNLIGIAMLGTPLYISYLRQERDKAKRKAQDYKLRNRRRKMREING